MKDEDAVLLIKGGGTRNNPAPPIYSCNYFPRLSHAVSMQSLRSADRQVRACNDAASTRRAGTQRPGN